MHLELGAKRTVGVHYATWILSDEHYLAPSQELRDAALKVNVGTQVMPGQHGRTMVFAIEEGSLTESSNEEKTEIADVNQDVDLLEARGGKCAVWR
jgi:N-acyl-phosphatidylethanolamine-hydrolysing phospholipase D